MFVLLVALIPNGLQTFVIIRPTYLFLRLFSQPKLLIFAAFKLFVHFSLKMLKCENRNWVQTKFTKLKSGNRV